MFSDVSAGAGPAAPPPGETGHSGPEPEEQNQQPGDPQRYHWTQYVSHTHTYTAHLFIDLSKIVKPIPNIR